jgi:hypothetical protein
MGASGVFSAGFLPNGGNYRGRGKTDSHGSEMDDMSRPHWSSRPARPARFEGHRPGKNAFAKAKKAKRSTAD